MIYLFNNNNQLIDTVHGGQIKSGVYEQVMSKSAHISEVLNVELVNIPPELIDTIHTIGIPYSYPSTGGVVKQSPQAMPTEHVRLHLLAVIKAERRGNVTTFECVSKVSYYLQGLAIPSWGTGEDMIIGEKPNETIQYAPKWTYREAINQLFDKVKPHVTIVSHNTALPPVSPISDSASFKFNANNSNFYDVLVDILTTTGRQVMFSGYMSNDKVAGLIMDEASTGVFGRKTDFRFADGFNTDNYVQSVDYENIVTAVIPRGDFYHEPGASQAGDVNLFNPSADLKNKATAQGFRITDSGMVVNESLASKFGIRSEVLKVKSIIKDDLLADSIRHLKEVEHGGISFTVSSKIPNDLHIGDEVTVTDGTLERKGFIVRIVRDVRTSQVIEIEVGRRQSIVTLRKVDRLIANLGADVVENQHPVTRALTAKADQMGGVASLMDALFNKPVNDAPTPSPDPVAPDEGGNGGSGGDTGGMAGSLLSTLDLRALNGYYAVYTVYMTKQRWVYGNKLYNHIFDPSHPPQVQAVIDELRTSGLFEEIDTADNRRYHSESTPPFAFKYGVERGGWLMGDEKYGGIKIRQLYALPSKSDPTASSNSNGNALYNEPIPDVTCIEVWHTPRKGTSSGELADIATAWNYNDKLNPLNTRATATGDYLKLNPDTDDQIDPIAGEWVGNDYIEKRVRDPRVFELADGFRKVTRHYFLSDGSKVTTTNLSQQERRWKHGMDTPIHEFEIIQHLDLAILPPMFPHASSQKDTVQYSPSTGVFVNMDRDKAGRVWAAFKTIVAISAMPTTIPHHLGLANNPNPLTAEQKKILDSIYGFKLSTDSVFSETGIHLSRRPNYGGITNAKPYPGF